MTIELLRHNTLNHLYWRAETELLDGKSSTFSTNDESRNDMSSQGDSFKARRKLIHHARLSDWWAKLMRIKQYFFWFIFCGGVVSLNRDLESRFDAKGIKQKKEIVNQPWRKKPVEVEVQVGGGRSRCRIGTMFSDEMTSHCTPNYNVVVRNTYSLRQGGEERSGDIKRSLEKTAILMVTFMEKGGRFPSQDIYSYRMMESFQGKYYV